MERDSEQEIPREERIHTQEKDRRRGIDKKGKSGRGEKER